MPSPHTRAILHHPDHTNAQRLSLSRLIERENMPPDSASMIGGSVYAWFRSGATYAIHTDGRVYLTGKD